MPADIAELRSLYDLRMRVEVEYPGTRRERGPRTVRLIETERGMIVHSDLAGLSGKDLDAAIEGELARFGELGLLGDLEWKLFGHDRPPELLDRLLAHGFVPREPADAVLVLELSELPPDFRDTRGHDVRRLPAAEALDATVAIMKAVWPEEETESWRRSIEASIEADPEGMSLYLAFVDGLPVAEARIDFAGREFAGLWGGATLPGYRERGIYSALVAARAAEALERGARFLTIDASPMSRAILEKRGFRFLDTALECNYNKG
jgi:GNAT superfamily N-acetyltransferase